MLSENEFSKVKADINKARDAILLKKAKSEEMKQEAEKIAQQLIGSGVLTRDELDNDLERIMEKYEAELLEYHRKIVALF